MGQRKGQALRRKRVVRPEVAAETAWRRRLKKLGFIKGKKAVAEERSVWRFDERDAILYALLIDPVYCAELLGEDPSNYAYAGMFKVRDYQYPLFRTDDNYAGFACARSVGKTVSIMWRAVTHGFKRIGENLLITAPEMIHLLPLTNAIEDKIRSVRLLREFLDTRGQKTGFTHRPFGVDFIDGTKIVGRIPRLSGTGVKGQHQPDLLIDEAQDYPEKGWTEVHETVLKDHRNRQGEPDFVYHFYGVHSGARDTGFFNRANKGGFKMVNITAIQRLNWSREEKKAAIASYGGTAAGDYRRNILGEAGGAASPFFVTARLVACVDQNPESQYNTAEIRPGRFFDDGGMFQRIRTEEWSSLGIPVEDMLDLPDGYTNVYGGMDIGLRISPTVIMLFDEQIVKGAPRLKLFRRIHLERMAPRQIREVMYAIAHTYGMGLKGFGVDITGMGLPMWMEMESDEECPPHLWSPDGGGVAQGYFFNAKVPIGIEKERVVPDGHGGFRDKLGAAVTEEVDPNTNQVRYVIHMPMVEAGTHYLREFVDTRFLLLPFDTEITADMQGESQQRVRRIAGLKQKPNAFHILDAMRAMAMVYKRPEIERVLAYDTKSPVLERAF